jgi:hypothetical protein
MTPNAVFVNAPAAVACQYVAYRRNPALISAAAAPGAGNPAARTKRKGYPARLGSERAQQDGRGEE